MVGLWKNNDITNSTSEWTRINGVPGNLAVSVIVQDEDNPSLLYVGTGENYTNGDALLGMVFINQLMEGMIGLLFLEEVHLQQ